MRVLTTGFAELCTIPYGCESFRTSAPHTTNRTFGKEAPMPARCNPFVYWLFALLASVSFTTHGQEYPARAVRIVVPFPPGGGTDVFARIMGQRLIEALGQ